MKSLYLRIYATLVVVLLLFALVAGWLFSRNVEHRRAEGEAEMSERVSGWSEVAQNNLPAASAPLAEQRDAVMGWSTRLGLAMALDDAAGKRIATSSSYQHEEEERGLRSGPLGGMIELPLTDGRVLRVLMRHGPPPRMRGQGDGPRQGQGPAGESGAMSENGSGSGSGSSRRGALRSAGPRRPGLA